MAGAGALAVATLGGALTTIGPWYYGLAKPSFQPPDWLFAPAWTLIFALSAFAAAAYWRAAPNPAARRRVVVLFAANGALNALWSLLFFTLQRPDWALLEVPVLWLSVLVLMLLPGAPHARWLLLPYLLWVGFAAVLNLAIVRLNAPFA